MNPPTDTLTPPARPPRTTPLPARRPAEVGFWAGVALLALAAGAAAALARNAERLMDGFAAREARDFRWVVFLEAHADRPFIESRLLALPGVRLSRFVTKEEALERAQQWPALAEGLALTSRNPLPESFEVEWDPGFIRPVLLVPLAERVAALDGVADVGYDRGRVERLALLTRLREQIHLGLLFLLAFGMAAVVGWISRVLFWSLAPFPAAAVGGGLLIGAIAGAAGAAAVQGWLGGWDPAALAAGPLVGLLAGLGRSA